MTCVVRLKVSQQLVVRWPEETTFSQLLSCRGLNPIRTEHFILQLPVVGLSCRCFQRARKSEVVPSLFRGMSALVLAFVENITCAAAKFGALQVTVILCMLESSSNTFLDRIEPLHSAITFCSIACITDGLSLFVVIRELWRVSNTPLGECKQLAQLREPQRQCQGQLRRQYQGQPRRQNQVHPLFVPTTLPHGRLSRRNSAMLNPNSLRPPSHLSRASSPRNSAILIPY